MLCFALISPKMTILLPSCLSPTRLLLLLQGPVFDQRRLNRVVRPPWSRRSSFLLPTPHPPPLPQTATPEWRRKTLLPSVGSRWSPSAVHSNFPLHPPSFPSSCSPGSLTLVSIPPHAQFLLLLHHLLHPLLLCTCVGSARDSVRCFLPTVVTSEGRLVVK